MKALQIILSALLVISLVATALFYHYGGHAGIFNHLILGFPEMFISMSCALFLSMLITICVGIGDSNEYDSLNEQYSSSILIIEKERKEYRAIESKLTKITYERDSAILLGDGLQKTINELKSKLTDSEKLIFDYEKTGNMVYSASSPIPEKQRAKKSPSTKTKRK